MGAKLAHQQLQEVVHVDSDVEADNEPEEGGGFQIGSGSESESVILVWTPSQKEPLQAKRTPPTTLNVTCPSKRCFVWLS